LEVVLCAKAKADNINLESLGAIDNSACRVSLVRRVLVISMGTHVSPIPPTAYTSDYPS
jgi:hypothetical protein